MTMHYFVISHDVTKLKLNEWRITLKSLFTVPMLYIDNMFRCQHTYDSV